VRNPFGSTIWRNQAFVRVWTAATISIFGSLVTRIALPLVAILVLGSGALEVAVLRGLDLGATLVFGLVAGAWVDRLRRRPVLIWADLGRAVLLGSVPVAFLLGVLTFPQLLIVSGLAAVLTTFFDAADNAYLPTIVERDRLVDANSALAASGSAAEFMAFGISGFLVQIFTAPIAIAIDAVSYLVSATRWGVGPVAIGGMLLAAVGNAFIPLAPSGLPLVAVGCLVVQQLVADSAVTVYDITEVSVRQTLVQDRALGRVSSTFHVLAVLAQLTATLAAGVLAEAIGLRATSWLAPLGGLLGAAILWFSPVRHLITLPAAVGGGGLSLDPHAIAVATEMDQPPGA